MNLRHLAFTKAKSVAETFGVFLSREASEKKQHLKYFLRWARINCVLDVGAFVGEYALELRELGYDGRIISFEPFPDSFTKMSLKLEADPLWSGQPYGLSDVSRDTSIHTYGGGEFNSLLDLKEEAETAYELDNAKRGEIQIKLRQLDEVLPALLAGIDSPRIFLKIGL